MQRKLSITTRTTCICRPPGVFPAVKPHDRGAILQQHSRLSSLIRNIGGQVPVSQVAVSRLLIALRSVFEHRRDSDGHPSRGVLCVGWFENRRLGDIASTEMTVKKIDLAQHSRGIFLK